MKCTLCCDILYLDIFFLCFKDAAFKISIDKYIVIKLFTCLMFRTVSMCGRIYDNKKTIDFLKLSFHDPSADPPGFNHDISCKLFHQPPAADASNCPYQLISRPCQLMPPTVLQLISRPCQLVPPTFLNS